MKIALYKNLDYVSDIRTIHQVSDYTESNENMERVSEIIEVEFAAIKEDQEK